MRDDPAQMPRPRKGRTGDTALRGGAWTVLERVLSQVSQLVIFVTAARLLSPAEFGVFALVSTGAILLLRFSEAAWAPYIMSWSGDETVPRQVVMISVYSGLLLGAAGALAGLALPLFGLSVATGHLAMLFALWVTIATVSSAQKGMMIWQGGLRASALAEILGDIVGMAVAVSALLQGWGVFALAFGRLAFQTTHLALSFGFTRATPLPGLRGEALADLVAYSRQMFASRMIANLRLYVATFLIGGFLGPAAVGYYRAAQRLVGAVAEIVGQPAQILAWNQFRKARDAGQNEVQNGAQDSATAPRPFQQAAELYFPTLLALGAPVFLWLGLMSEDLIRGLLGEKWLPALPVVAVLALARAIITPGVATEPILSLAGEVRRLPLFSIIFLVATVAFTLVAAPFGLMPVAWAQVAVSIFIILVTSQLLRRHGGISWGGVARAAWHLVPPIALSTALLLFLRDTALFEGLPPLARALGVILPCLPVYLISMALSDPRLRALLRSRGRLG